MSKKLCALAHLGCIQILKYLVFFSYYSRLHDYSVPRIHFAVPDSHMDCDYLVSGTIYKVLLLIQSHSFAEYAPSLQSADFTSDQDMVLWHVSIHNDYLPLVPGVVLIPLQIAPKLSMSKYDSIMKF